ITETDAGDGTITFTSQYGGGPVSIKVTASTKYFTQTSATVADLKVNDQVQVQGMPTGITASSILFGDMPFLANVGPGAQGAPARPGSPTAADENGSSRNPQQSRMQATASAVGRVTSISPLT